MLYGAMAGEEEKMEISCDPLVLWVPKHNCLICSTILTNPHSELSVPFQSQFEAEIAHNTLVVDPEPPRSEVVKSFRVDGAILHVWVAMILGHYPALVKIHPPLMTIFSARTYIII